MDDEGALFCVALWEATLSESESSGGCLGSRGKDLQLEMSESGVNPCVKLCLRAISDYLSTRTNLTE